MKRHERRQLEREKKKKTEGSFLEQKIQKYVPQLKKFYDEKKGTAFEWLKTLEHEELCEIQESVDGESKDATWVMYLAIMAHCLFTGSNSIEDENPDTENSTMRKIMNHFIFLANSAQLENIGLVNFKFNTDDFFNFEEDGVHVNVVDREDLSDENKRIFDEAEAFNKMNAEIKDDR